MVEKIADNKQLLDAKKDKIRQRAVGYFDIVKTTKEIEDIYKNLL